MRKGDYSLFVYCKMPLFRWGMKSRNPLFIEVSWKEFVFLPMDKVVKLNVCAYFIGNGIMPGCRAVLDDWKMGLALWY